MNGVQGGHTGGSRVRRCELGPQPTVREDRGEGNGCPAVGGLARGHPALAHSGRDDRHYTGRYQQVEPKPRPDRASPAPCAGRARGVPGVTTSTEVQCQTLRPVLSGWTCASIAASGSMSADGARSVRRSAATDPARWRVMSQLTSITALRAREHTWTSDATRAAVKPSLRHADVSTSVRKHIEVARCRYRH